MYNVSQKQDSEQRSEVQPEFDTGAQGRQAKRDDEVSDVDFEEVK